MRATVLGGLLVLVALPLFAAQANAAYDVNSPPSFTYVNDENGADDYPGQKDLNAQAVTTVAGSPLQLWFAVKWDDIDFSGGNTGDACALFDTDTDSKINSAICVRIGGSPAAQLTGSPVVYTCGDGKNDRCTSKYKVVSGGQTACKVVTGSDPFHASLSDTVAWCRVDLAAVGAGANLANTCSYPSGEPTSDPSDCVLIPRDAFLKVTKVANPNDGTAFPFTVTASDGTSANYTINGSGNTGFVAIRSTLNYSVSETVPAGWGIDGTPTCTGASPASANGTFSAATSTISGIDPAADNQITCTFTDKQLAGSLSIHKYIDRDENGQETAASESTIGLSGVLSGDLTGWGITVTGPGGFSCTGTTNSSGILTSCLKADNTAADLTMLTAGTYTVQENTTSKTIGDNASSVFNTDPGGALPVSEQAVVTAGGSASVAFGNTCYNTATFSVTGVAAGQTGLFAAYKVNAGTTQKIVLTQVGNTTTYSASIGNLRKDDVVTWNYGIGYNTAGEQSKPLTETMTTSGYTACSASGSVSFSSATINGSKFNDTDGDGTKDAGEGGLQGFTFQLKQGSDVKATTKSDATGDYSFANVAPGDYTIHEVAVTGWKQTTPASDADVTVSVGVSDTTKTAAAFGNTPLSDITVTFNPRAKLLNADGTPSSTDATKATSIACTDTDNAGVGSTTTSNTKTTNSLQVKQSSVTCVVGYGKNP